MILIRILRSAYTEAVVDLNRPHPFAGERVGFLRGRVGRAGSAGALLLMTSYAPVPDEDYVEDATVGARIGTGAIRHALQHALESGDVMLHVHAHGHRGRPEFSPIDFRELKRLVPSFLAVAPATPHGALVLSENHGHALLWTRRDRPPVPAVSISVVGFPTVTWRSS